MAKRESFPIPVWSGVLTHEHIRAMSPMGVCLFMFFLDKITKEIKGEGYVWGGKPIRYQDIADRLPVDERQYRRLVKKLRAGGYISTEQTNSGLIIVVNKSKKFITSSVKKDLAKKRERTRKSPRPDKNVLPDRSEMSGPPDGSDKTVDKTRIGEGVPPGKIVWNLIHKIFALPEGAYGGYVDSIESTIKRLGFDVTMAALDKFMSTTDDHPPDGRIKRIAELFYFNKIDLYVGMLPKTDVLNYYGCPECGDLVMIEARRVYPGISNKCRKCSVTRIDVSNVVRVAKAKKWADSETREAVKAVIEEWRAKRG